LRIALAQARVRCGHHQVEVAALVRRHVHRPVGLGPGSVASSSSSRTRARQRKFDRKARRFATSSRRGLSSTFCSTHSDPPVRRTSSMSRNEAGPIPEIRRNAPSGWINASSGSSSSRIARAARR
jgi:hypothetical protein